MRSRFAAGICDDDARHSRCAELTFASSAAAASADDISPGVPEAAAAPPLALAAPLPVLWMPTMSATSAASAPAVPHVRHDGPEHGALKGASRTPR